MTWPTCITCNTPYIPIQGIPGCPWCRPDQLFDQVEARREAHLAKERLRDARRRAQARLHH